MELKPALLFLSILLLSSCSLFKTTSVLHEYAETEKHSFSSILALQSEDLAKVTPPITQPVVAVYPTSFTDQTGQRKSNGEFALFSTAVTQAPNALLIRALKHASNGKFFRVVERVGLDNLTKERQLIRSTRQASNNEEKESKKLMPLLFAGVIMQGAVVSYDSNVRTGGVGARYLGIGASTQYKEDVVTISLRMVSVATGEILIEVMTEKTILSYGQSQDAFRFIELGTELLEIELGNAYNESSTIALQKAIEGAVLELINIGYEKKYWVSKK